MKEIKDYPDTERIIDGEAAAGELLRNHRATLALLLRLAAAWQDTQKAPARRTTRSATPGTTSTWPSRHVWRRCRVRAAVRATGRGPLVSRTMCGRSAQCP